MASYLLDNIMAKYIKYMSRKYSESSTSWLSMQKTDMQTEQYNMFLHLLLLFGSCSTDVDNEDQPLKDYTHAGPTSTQWERYAHTVDLLVVIGSPFF